jgi:hypothetical protein
LKTLKIKELEKKINLTKLLKRFKKNTSRFEDKRLACYLKNNLKNLNPNYYKNK